MTHSEVFPIKGVGWVGVKLISIRDDYQACQEVPPCRKHFNPSPHLGTTISVRPTLSISHGVVTRSA